ncbi:glycosyltransferase family 2 protein [Sulfuricurvum sp.]|uniref:glycosyltransferase family 2 protein n=1 Tax=Sulfuricurvum sp. TaxID=2025608 RepID=UPI00260CD1C7|nr:glycosyltransferase family 2 protein [Sulfuricurvum sp.]MDD3596887.1 glycosyltransferase family 2 protein [Sulfuricurvum sp.]
MEKVSILIPTYERPEGLKKAIQSCLAQVYSHFEIIVTDNSSNDKCREIIDSFHDERIKYYINEENIGPILNWRRAFEKSNGELIVLLPDDDYFLNPFFLKDAVQICAEMSVELFIPDCVVGNEKNCYMNKSSFSGMTESSLVIETLWGSSNIPTIANVFSRKITKDVIFFYDNNILYSDIELWLKLLMKTEFVYFYNIPSVFYTIHTSNIVFNMDNEKLIQNSNFITRVFSHDRLMETKFVKKYIQFLLSIFPTLSFPVIWRLLKKHNCTWNEYISTVFLYVKKLWKKSKKRINK